MGTSLQISALVVFFAALFPLLDFLLLFPGVPVLSKGGILVTGASSGIGRHAAISLSEFGYLVFPTVRKQSDADSLLKEAPGVHPIIMDVTNSEQIAKAFETVRSELSERKLDFIALVNNAGVLKNAPIEAQPLKDMHFMYDVNVFGLISVTQQFLPLLRETGAGARLVKS